MELPVVLLHTACVNTVLWIEFDVFRQKSVSIILYEFFPVFEA